MDLVSPGCGNTFLTLHNNRILLNVVHFFFVRNDEALFGSVCMNSGRFHTVYKKLWLIPVYLSDPEL